MFVFEIEILKFLESIRSDVLTVLIEGITLLAEETLLILLVVILYFAVDKRLAQRLFFITAASLGVNSLIKSTVKTPRPWTTGEVSCVRPETATGYSFPSGHTQNFATWSTVLAMQLKKRWLMVVVSVMILLVAFSRLYLGAHYPSDVVVGIVLALVIAAAGNWLFDKVEAKWKLFAGMTAVFTPFAVWFLIQGDPMYGDMFKFYGAVAGFGLGIVLEGRYAPIDYNVVWWKKVVRVVIGLVLCIAVKEGVKLLDVFGIVRVTFLFHAVRYFLVVMVCAALCPALFKRFRL